MLVWLASYPRSGNTLLRIIARQALGTGTYSVYDDRYDIGADPELAEVVGHIEHGMPEDEFIAWARAQPGIIFAKTHEPDPRKLTDPAVYVVRDGRAATVSYWRYSQEIAKSETTLMDVVHGNIFAGDWSSHVRRWLVGGRRGPTLLLRFEELAAHPEREWARVGRFLKLEASDASLNVDFSELNQKFPHFFRSGSNEKNIAAFTPAVLAEFNRLHAPTLQALGYSLGAGPIRPMDVPALRKLGAAQVRHDTLLELSAAGAIATYQADLARRLEAVRLEFSDSLGQAIERLNATPDDQDRISAEVARQVLADLAPLETLVQERLQASSQRVTAASEAMSRLDREAGGGS